MRKKGLLCLVALLLSGIFSFSDSPCVFARTFLKDADNKLCPVTGQPIEQKKYYSTYDGEKYWFRSYDAVLEFDKNPKKYAKSLKSHESVSNKKNRRF